MFNERYDSYGYRPNNKFYTTADLRNLKYPPVKRVPQEYTEIDSFFSEAGQPTVDLVEPIIGGESDDPPQPTGDYICFYGAYSGGTVTSEVVTNFNKVTTDSVSFNPTVVTEYGEYIWLVVPSVLSISGVECDGFEVTLKNGGSPDVLSLGVLGTYKAYRSLNQLDKNTWKLNIS